MQLATLALADGTTTAACRPSEQDPWRRLPAAQLNELLTQDWEDALSAAATAPTVTGSLSNPLPAPGKVICCGLNYRDHILEMGRELPEYPTLFAKYADSLVGPTDAISLRGTTKVDWEAELAVVVGKPLCGASREEALAGIAGYTVANDVSARDWQKRTLQWFQGKAWSRSTPIGPVVVTPESFDPASGPRIHCAVNDETVQDSTLDQLVFDAADLLVYVSAFADLNPGDVVLTGTPGGVGAGMEPPRFLRDGDTLTTEIEGIGTLTNTISISNPTNE